MSNYEVQANCVELCLQRVQDQYPRNLRGGSRPTCLRSLHNDSLEQQHIDLQWRLCGDITESQVRDGEILVNFYFFPYPSFESELSIYCT